MRRRLLAAVAALLLAVLGTVVLLAYVRGADSRALAGAEPVDVLVVDQLVAEGTPAEDLAASVRTEQVPAKAAVDGRVTDLADLAGQVATADLQPGEQLLASRFAAPDALQTPGTVAVPDGAEEVSVLLDPQRAVGGRLVAGDTVGVFVSLDEPATTHVILHRVVVTQVQGAPAPADTGEEGATQTASAGSPAPTGSLMVTLAVTAEQVEGVVFGAEHGTLWLSLETDGSDVDGTEVITPDTVYGKDYA
ncbi:pilus assembly protein CpaB [Modestobacter sp. DSM 44400]|uniref:Flp pilus assembly protein CpaB n=1 Tax=Modestobacter sp. DSM 44400 TaxID=1550230 RepID=UPI000899B8D6|nr:RcpC/CpaB family pilus assembly protein [Modestobacter sp. DSM 44400]SDY67824.1 pilus assembly protein CpaB [Modestobacter sp. DSM 44400]